MLSLEIKKIINRMEFWFFAVAMLIGSTFDVLINCKNFMGSKLTEVYPAYSMTVLDNVSRSPFRIVYVIFLPFIVCIMASDTYLNDKNTGMNNFILTRVNRKKYIWNKALAIALLVFLVIEVNLAINYICCRIAFPAYGYRVNGEVLPFDLVSNVGYGDRVLDRFALYNPYANLLIWSLLRGAEGVTFALLAYGLSFVKGVNRYKILFSSFVIYNMLEIALLYAETYVSVPNIIGNFLMMNPRCSLIEYVIEMLLFLCVIVGLIMIGARSEEV